MVQPIYFSKDANAFGFLCQWYPATLITPDGQEWKCAEQYMMWRKAMHFKDTTAAEQSLKNGSNARKCKTLGRATTGFSDEQWDPIKLEVVEEVSYYQYTTRQRPTDEAFVELLGEKSLKEALLATGDQELVEASPFDRVWGIGFSADAAFTKNRANWGQNLLGKALMARRERIRRKEEESKAAMADEEVNAAGVDERTEES